MSSAHREFEAYILLTIPHATLNTPDGPVSGDLALEYVTFPDRQAKDAAAPDVLLVIRIGSYETVLDPSHAVQTSSLPSGEQRYVLRGVEGRDLTLVLPSGQGGAAADDLETFHGILSEYGGFAAQDTAIASIDDANFTLEKPAPDEDLRGRFILVNEDNNEVVGALDRNVHIHEDPTLYAKGHETDPVVVELPEGVDDLTEAEVMVRAIPEEDRGWMINGAMVATRVISGATTMLNGAMTAASQLYIKHSTPSPHASPGGASVDVPPPSRTLLMLRSPKTRQHLTRVHGYSGQAAKLSNKTIGLIDKAIDRLVRYDNTKGKGRAVPPPPTLAPSPIDSKPPLPPRRSVSPAPPPYSADDKHPLSPARDEKPPLPPRKLSPRPDVSVSGSSTSVPSITHPAEVPGKTKGPSMKARIALSAALVLASIDTNATRLVEGGSNAIVAAVAHKHGQDAGENARMATGTARNVVLVYVDVAGMGRRAIVKRVVKKSVKSVAQKHMKVNRPANADSGKN
ncbi:unnamed protein product [Peniophora sp. CBMAI 1063]|nr:unnamed protein product [Peniophora sp. CBMAI 1063]